MRYDTLESIIESICSGDVIVENCVAFTPWTDIIRIWVEREVRGIICVSLGPKIHIPRFIIASLWAMNPVEYFLLQYITVSTQSSVFKMPAIACKDENKLGILKRLKELFITWARRIFRKEV